MTTTYSGRSAVCGFKRQASEGTAETVPDFEIPMGDGGVIGPERTDADLPWTNDSQDQLGGYVQKINGIVDAPLPVLPVSSVALLQAVLGSRSTGAAVSGIYPHTITPSDVLPWYTWFYAQPGGNYHTVGDVKLGNAELRFSGGNPLELGVSGQGKLPATRAGSKWSTATLVESATPFFTYIGSTMKFESSTTPATTEVSNIQSGTIGIDRNLQGVQTNEVTDSYEAEGLRAITCDLAGVVMENQDLINTVFYGASGGTTASSVIAYGSIDFLFLNSNQVAAATSSLQITIPNIKWMIDRVPASSSSGDVVTYDVSGVAYKPASGAIITALVKNATAGTAY